MEKSAIRGGGWADVLLVIDLAVPVRIDRIEQLVRRCARHLSLDHRARWPPGARDESLAAGSRLILRRAKLTNHLDDCNLHVPPHQAIGTDDCAFCRGRNLDRPAAPRAQRARGVW